MKKTMKKFLIYLLVFGTILPTWLAIGVLKAPKAEAANSDINQIVFIPANPLVVNVNTISPVLHVQTQDALGSEKSVDNGTKLTLETSSLTGQFTDASSGNCNSNWSSAPAQISMTGGHYNNYFCYRDSMAGDYTLTVNGLGQTWTPAIQNIVITSPDILAPTLTITGATADGVSMEGNVENGFTLYENNDPLKEYLLQFKSGTSADEALGNEYFGLKLVDSTVSADVLKTYYDLRGTPEPFLTYLKDAVDGVNPFVYINGSTIKLVDAARHYILGGADTSMAIPGDYPIGTYTLEGKVEDIAGNETTVTLKLNIAIVSSLTTITSETYTISTGGIAFETITNIPFGTSKDDFLSALVKGESHQTWVENISDPVVTGDTIVVTAQDGTTIVTYTITTLTAEETAIENLIKAKNAADLLVQEDYTPASWTVLVDALALSEITNAEVIAKTTAINTAIEELVLEVDLTNYNAVLAAVKQTDYTTSSWEAYSAIVSANTVTIDNTQAEIDTATALIVTAQGSLVFAGQVDLDRAIAVVGLLKSYYTSESWTVLIMALTLPETTNAEVVAKATAINAAVLGLVLNPAPVITAEAAKSVTTTSATITWTTDHIATSRVVYDTVSHSVLGGGNNYGYAFSSFTYDTTPRTTSHFVLITDLTPGTVYYYRTISYGYPEQIGAEMTFTTAALAPADKKTSTVSVAPAPAEAATPEPSTSVEGTPIQTNNDDQGVIKGEEDQTSTDENKTNWTPWIVLFVLIILAGAATGGYFYWFGAEDEVKTTIKNDSKDAKTESVTSKNKNVNKKEKRW